MILEEMFYEDGKGSNIQSTPGNTSEDEKWSYW